MQNTTEHATWTDAGRTFWWGPAPRVDTPVDAEVYPLQAVIFDLEALGAPDFDVAAAEPRAGVVDLMMSLFGAGLCVAVVSAGARDWVQARVRELIGDGMAETVVCADDLTGPAGDAGLYRLVLWELGIVAGEALVIAGSEAGGRTATGLGLPTVAIGDSGYDGLTAAGCRELQAELVVARLSGRVAG